MIVTDSTADIPHDLALDLGIKVIPVNLVLDNKTYKDGIHFNRASFYDRFDTYSTMNSQPVRHEDYALELLQAAQENDEILAIHCSRHLSKTYEIAQQVNQEYLSQSSCRFMAIDSGQCSMGLGMIVIEAARAMKAGEPFDQVVLKANKASASLKSYMAVPTLKYLKKNKKIGGMKSLIGLAMGVKPVLEMDNGKMVIKSKLLGKQQNMILSMMDSIKADVKDKPISLAIVYAGDKTLVQRLRDIFEFTFDCKDLYISRFSPSISINTGPESYAVFFTAHE